MRFMEGDSSSWETSGLLRREPLGIVLCSSVLAGKWIYEYCSMSYHSCYQAHREFSSALTAIKRLPEQGSRAIITLKEALYWQNWGFSYLGAGELNICSYSGLLSEEHDLQFHYSEVTRTRKSVKSVHAIITLKEALYQKIGDVFLCAGELNICWRTCSAISLFGCCSLWSSC